MHYTLQYPSNANRYINITALIEADNSSAATIRFQVPAWRPGRYELANYAQNIRNLTVQDDKGNPIAFKKLLKDEWEISTNQSSFYTITYQYYANQLDAGASYVDDNQLYINPVNCLIYQKDKINKQHTIQVIGIPNNWRVASALYFDSNQTATCNNYHELADSPFIFAPDLKHNQYIVDNTTFHIWIKGECRPKWDKLLSDFEKFTTLQIQIFKQFPVNEYHFLFQFPNVKFYHGVEHITSTVICLGPGYKIMESIGYHDLLAISSHELFHVWNVKTIRPIEMFPYDYTKENYSNLGYVAEGVTTYYGDLTLLRCGVYNFEEFNFAISADLNRHFQNKGRFFMSLAESSFDTWLDGYKPGAPDRKISMYFKGAIVALMLDIHILKATNNQKSLDEVMQLLYDRYFLKGKGYSESDYLSLVSEVAGEDMLGFFKEYYWGVTPLEEPLNQYLNYIGCELIAYPSSKTIERVFGIKSKEEATNKNIIGSIYEGSPADIGGLQIGDKIVSVNSLEVDSNTIDDIFDYFKNNSISIFISRGKNVLNYTLTSDNQSYYYSYELAFNPKKDEDKLNYEFWKGRRNI